LRLRPQGRPRVENADETLEVAQVRKMDLICQKLGLEPGHALLDIGCGWGSLAVHAAKHVGATALGVSIAQEQINFGLERAAKEGVADKVDLRVMDYRDLDKVNKKFDRISCVEMSEHVGIVKYAAFLQLVKSLLTDDGVFYLQIAGLRRAWQFEDLVWGVFMGTYIFPAADASMPLNWVINQLETAGFEVRSVDTIGIHYSHTIHAWYRNWLGNKDSVVEKYGEYWYRLWSMFLAWSTIIAKQGSSTCFQIVAHKNLNDFTRDRFVGARA